MFCVSEEPILKEDIIATENTHVFGRIEEFSFIEDTIQSCFKKCQIYKVEDFEGTFPHIYIDEPSTSYIQFNPLEFNLNTSEEKEEDPNIYYHNLDISDNASNKLPSKTTGQEHVLFKKDNNEPDDKPINNSNFRNNIRYKERQPRYMNNDNIRRIIKRRFFNTYLKTALNKKLKLIGYKELFHNFPQKLVGEIAKKKNKELINMTLLQIFENNDSYINKDLINYKYNLNIIKKIKTDEKGEIYFIFNKKFNELFEEYVNSDEFKKEIERVNSKHRNEENEEFYLKRYAYLAKTFIKFYL